MRIVFMGTPDYAVPVLAKLAKHPDLEVVAVCTPPDRPRGRGKELAAPPVKTAALALGLPVMQPNSLRSRRVQENLAGLSGDVFVVAAYGKLLPAEVLALPPHGCLNIHPSLLPKYRGPSPVVSALLDGVDETGVTLMLLDEGMDSGPIIAQQKLTLTGDETAESLTLQLFRMGADLLIDALGPWTAGQMEAIQQEESLATVTRKLERNDGVADWNLTPSELERRQRALTPWPGLFTRWGDRALRLVEVKAVTSSPALVIPAGAEPGMVIPLSLEETPVGVVVAGGALGLKTVQLEGRRAMPAGDFLRGNPDFLGSVL